MPKHAARLLLLPQPLNLVELPGSATETRPLQLQSLPKQAPGRAPPGSALSADTARQSATSLLTIESEALFTAAQPRNSNHAGKVHINSRSSNTKCTMRTVDFLQVNLKQVIDKAAIITTCVPATSLMHTPLCRAHCQTCCTAVRGHDPQAGCCASSHIRVLVVHRVAKR